MTVTTIDRRHAIAAGPVQAVLVAGTVPVFLGALLSDIAYARTYEIQWNNFASWLIAGGLVVGAGALIAAVIDLLRAPGRDRRQGLLTLLLLVLWLAELWNALVHARDAWAGMPAGLVLSAIVTVLAGAATWIAFRTPRPARTP